MSDVIIRECWDWILTHATFEAWVEDDDATMLWIQGSPGKGKTAMVIGIIDFLMQEAWPGAREVFVSHFFCRSAVDTADTALAAVKGLIFGLTQKQPNPIRFLRTGYRLPEDIGGAQLGELWGVLAKMLRNAAGFKTIYLVVDAFDECRRDGRVLDFLDLLRKDPSTSTSSSTRVKWLFVSRPSYDFGRFIGPGRGRSIINLDDEEGVDIGVGRFIDLVI